MHLNLNILTILNSVAFYASALKYEFKKKFLKLGVKEEHLPFKMQYRCMNSCTSPGWGGQLSQTSPGRTGQLSLTSILRNCKDA